MVLRAAEQLRNSSLSKETRTLETHVHSKANKSTEDRLRIKSNPVVQHSSLCIASPRVPANFLEVLAVWDLSSLISLTCSC